ncbi:uncharacterized protein LOC130662296 [Hydractinia symbiolongicarpus]|uniref:uncharacterized protein LOC130662296 n=1 Tax=Hydractinia symbiolongicarpus TaxID=13093 RepID=UPI00254B52C1|nr:uncharacterized protein LOC130662296 [Hydractinia symbiolongicarpus]
MKLLFAAFISAVFCTVYGLKCHVGYSVNPHQIKTTDCSIIMNRCLLLKFSLSIETAGNVNINVEEGRCWNELLSKDVLCPTVKNVTDLIKSCNATVCDTDECNVISGQCPSAAVVTGPNLLVLFVTFIILMTSLKVF